MTEPAIVETDEEAADAIIRVIERESRVWRCGILEGYPKEIRSETAENKRRWMDGEHALLLEPESIHRFRYCVAWLREAPLLRHAPSKPSDRLGCQNSYHLKHVIEMIRGEYTTNVAVILAGIYLGIPYDEQRVNAAFAISKRWITAQEKIANAAENERYEARIARAAGVAS